MGEDPATLRQIFEQVKDVMQNSPMMRTVNTDWGNKVSNIYLILDQERIASLGLTPNTISLQLQMFLSGISISQMREDIRSVQITGRAKGDIRQLLI